MIENGIKVYYNLTKMASSLVFNGITYYKGSAAMSNTYSLGKHANAILDATTTKDY